ncbi:UDP-glucuronosyl/UDP-glucosyltransferase [Penicillium expansum]|nr:UDP-glucuronosyl/UDP-glucosyltransferase [Penicillium expansum]
MTDLRPISTFPDTDDPPPPYEALWDSDDRPMRQSILPPSELPCPTAPLPDLSLTEDGRVNMRVGLRFSRNLEWLMDTQPTQAEVSQTAEATFPTPASTFNLRLNIFIQVVGSHGDVQPFVALGEELQRHGHRVRLATHAKFESFVKSAGLGFYPIGGDPVQLMSYMVRNPGLIPSMKSLLAGDVQQKRASIAEILEGSWRSCIDPDPHDKRPFVADAIIANPPSFTHVHCGQALWVPVHLMFTMPWTPTRAFHHPLANLDYSENDPSLGNYISYHFVEWITWNGLGDLINTWRKDTLKLDTILTTEGPNLYETLKIPFTYCWSPTLTPKPEDWGPHIDVAGFFFREPMTFCVQVNPLVYIGFGSIVLEDVEKTVSVILEAIQMTGVRAIIAGGWSALHGRDTSSVYYIQDCPHEWLFKRVAAVVHHGGAGTTACGLRNGRPTTIIPFFGDQPFWGKMVATAGAGLDPIPYKSLTAQKLANAISYSFTPRAIAEAQSIAEKIKQESGVRAVVDSFHAHLPQTQMQCDLIPGEAAVWKLKKGKRILKLSNTAALVLKRQGRFQEKHFKRYQSKPFSIDPQRWDPLTAVSSASLSTLTGMADATAGIFIDPYQECKRLRSNRHTRLAIPVAASTLLPTGLLSTTEIQASTSHDAADVASNHASNDPNYARQMALASAISLGKFLGRSSRGMFVDLPLAATEGILAIPRLYGAPTRVHDPVRGWKSGAVVGWSTFSHGLYEGFTDIFVYTYAGKKNEGSVGVAKGLMKGLTSLTFKTGAATIGLIAYPNQGIYRSIRARRWKEIARRIMDARWAEAECTVNGRCAHMDVAVAGLCSLYDGFLVSREKRHKMR